jgi:MFS family permease
MPNKNLSESQIFYGWIITGLVFLNLAIAYGAQYSFGVLFPSLIAEFQWNRQSLAGAFSLYAFMYSFLGIILGRWADRFGPRPILLLGSICLGSGIALISQVKAPWHLYLFYGLLASWGMSATYITANPTVVKWFIEKRGMAVGIGQSGLGIGIIFIPPLTGFLIATMGWRLTCVVLGTMVFAILFTTSFFLIGHPEKVGLKPDGKNPLPTDQQGPQILPGNLAPPIINEISWSAAEAMRTKSFWILTALFFCTWLFVFWPLVHLMIFALDIGLSKKTALMAISILGGFSTTGRLIMGFISDRIGRKSALAINLGLQVFCWCWVLMTERSWMLYIFSALFGFSYGGVSAVFPAIVGDYFGRLKAASVIGAIFTLAGVSAAIGPILGGYIYDVTKSHQWSFLLGIFTNLAAFMLIFISKPPVRTEKNF